MGIKPRLPESCASCRAAVSVELKKVVDRCPAGLGQMLRYHMGWQDEQGQRRDGESGKFMRSTLCLLSCEAVGGDASEVMPAAAAVELVHNFSLLHDDIEDVSCERHHRPTVWRIWGQAQAINAGDAMFALAYLALLGLEERGVPGEMIVSAVRELSQACLDLCEGQYLDLEYERRLDITVEDYLDMAAKKTAALFAVSASLGAYLGRGDERVAGCLDLFGKELGMAYQIHDDLLGIWGTEEVTGKPADDISQRKKTLPVVYGLQNSRGEQKDRLAELYGRETIGACEMAEISRILEQTGARDYAEKLATQYYSRAMTQLEASGLAASRQAPLGEIASFLLKRDF